MGVGLNGTNYLPTHINAKPNHEPSRQDPWYVDDACNEKPEPICMKKGGCWPSLPEKPCKEGDCTIPKKPEYRMESSFGSLWKYDSLFNTDK